MERPMAPSARCSASLSAPAARRRAPRWPEISSSIPRLADQFSVESVVVRRRAPLNASSGLDGSSGSLA